MRGTRACCAYVFGFVGLIHGFLSPSIPPRTANTAVHMSTWAQSLSEAFTGRSSSTRTVAVTGSGGLIGSALARKLQGAGYEVLRVTTRPTKGAENALQWSIEDGVLDASKLEGVDAVVHLAGESISSIGLGGWSEEAKQKITESRRKGTQLVVRTINSLTRKPKVLITASAVGYYGYDRFDEVQDETSPKGTGFLADVADMWEAEARGVSKSVRLVNTRLGVVLSTGGGIVAKLQPLFWLGGGGNLGSGEQPFTWVSLRDAVKAIQFILENPTLNGPVNVCSPSPCTNAEFTKAFGQALFRPTIVPLPAIVAKTLFGQLADELLLGGQKCVPKKLLRAGFQFEDEEIDATMRALLSASKSA